MRNVGTLTQRELSTFFYSPIAYVVLAVFLVVTGLQLLLFAMWFDMDHNKGLK